MSAFIDLAKIRLDGGTQPRAEIFEETRDQYIEAMGRGDPFPPLVVFFDGEDYWLADGFHRYHAARALKRSGFNCDVTQGGQRDAILFSVGANADHGRLRTNDDKRRAVLRLLTDPEWSQWSDREIARRCRVDHKTVAALRPPAPMPEPEPHLGNSPDSSPEGRPRTVERGGTVYTMNTAPMAQRPAAVKTLTAPAPVAAFNARMDQDGPIHDAMTAIKDAFARMPGATEAARRYPAMLRHTFSANQARHIACWFNDLADAWEAENGECNVAPQ